MRSSRARGRDGAEEKRAPLEPVARKRRQTRRPAVPAQRTRAPRAPAPTALRFTANAIRWGQASEIPGGNALARERSVAAVAPGEPLAGRLQCRPERRLGRWIKLHTEFAEFPIKFRARCPLHSFRPLHPFSPLPRLRHLHTRAHALARPQPQPQPPPQPKPKPPTAEFGRPPRRGSRAAQARP